MVERILSLIKQSNINDHMFEKQLGFAQGTIGNWRKKKNKVSTEAIIKLAQYFNVSADYLLCLTNEPAPLQQTDVAKRPAYELSTELVELSQDKNFADSAKLYKVIPNEYKMQVCTYILGVATGLGLDIKQILEK